MSTKPVERLIEERAYEVYQRRVRSGVPGDQHSDWVQAEKEVREDLRKAEATKAKTPEAKPVIAAPKAPEVKPVAAVAPKVEVKPVAAVAPKAEVKEAVATAVKPAPAPVPVKKVIAKKAVGGR